MNRSSRLMLLLLCIVVGLAVPTLAQTDLDYDGDGLSDTVDSCPYEFGTFANGGCPTPDMDLDGVPDSLDRCPGLYGIATIDGCPVPNTDGDFLDDMFDQCPEEYALTEDGCPGSPAVDAPSPTDETTTGLFDGFGNDATEPETTDTLPVHEGDGAWLIEFAACGDSLPVKSIVELHWTDSTLEMIDHSLREPFAMLEREEEVYWLLGDPVSIVVEAQVAEQVNGGLVIANPNDPNTPLECPFLMTYLTDEIGDMLDVQIDTSTFTLIPLDNCGGAEPFEVMIASDGDDMLFSDQPELVLTEADSTNLLLENAGLPHMFGTELDAVSPTDPQSLEMMIVNPDVVFGQFEFAQERMCNFLAVSNALIDASGGN